MRGDRTRHAPAQTKPDVRVVRGQLRVLRMTSTIIADEEQRHLAFRFSRHKPQRNLAKVRTSAIEEPDHRSDPFAGLFGMDHFIFSDTNNEE